jgi:hypothetical protein
MLDLVVANEMFGQDSSQGSCPSGDENGSLTYGDRLCRAWTWDSGQFKCFESAFVQLSFGVGTALDHDLEASFGVGMLIGSQQTQTQFGALEAKASQKTPGCGCGDIALAADKSEAFDVFDVKPVLELKKQLSAELFWLELMLA